MSLLDVLRAIRRQLVVFLMLMMVAAAACAIVWVRVPVFYESQASVSVLTPNQRPGEGGVLFPVNPWEDFGSMSAQVAASLLASVAVSDEFQDRLRDKGVTSTVSAEVAPYGGEVVLLISAINRQNDLAENDLQIVDDELAIELRDRQLAAGAPESALLVMQDVTAATPAQPLVTDRTKVVDITAAIGVVVAFAASILLDHLQRNRKQGSKLAAKTATGGGTRRAKPRPRTRPRPTGGQQRPGHEQPGTAPPSRHPVTGQSADSPRIGSVSISESSVNGMASSTAGHLSPDSINGTSPADDRGAHTPR